VLEGGGGGEDPLDNEEQLGDQLDALPFLCRFQYDATSAYLLALMDPVLVAYQSAAAGGASKCPTWQQRKRGVAGSPHSMCRLIGNTQHSHSCIWGHQS